MPLHFLLIWIKEQGISAWTLFYHPTLSVEAGALEAYFSPPFTIVILLSNLFDDNRIRLHVH